MINCLKQKMSEKLKTFVLIFFCLVSPLVGNNTAWGHATSPSAMKSPAPGTVLTTSEITFTWTSGQGVSEIWLGMGTTLTSVASKPWGNIYAQSQQTSTSVTISDIPLTGQPIHVRLWSKINGEWLFQDYEYDTSAIPPIIEFRALPDVLNTNLPTMVVSGNTDADNHVFVNEIPVQKDSESNFVTTVPLASGQNVINLTIETPSGDREHIIKHIVYNNQFYTGDRRLVYVDVVKSRPDTEGQGLDGTVVLDLDGDTILGMLDNKHIRGLSPQRTEIYMADGSVFSTSFHEEESEKLHFTEPIQPNGFIISPDGLRLYSGKEVLNRQTNILEPSLPVSILTGSSYGGAAIPGTPTISLDGETIYCRTSRNRMTLINTLTNTTWIPRLPWERRFQSDVSLSPNGRILAKSSYGGLNSNHIGFYDSTSLSRLAYVFVQGDFIGQVAYTTDGKYALAGSAGNPRYRGGKVTVIDMNTFEIVSTLKIDLADNLAVSEKDEVLVSSANRLGLDILELQSDQTLTRVKSFFLGIGRWRQSIFTGPKNDEIRKIIYKSRSD
ncbi:MAG: hypothetical protein NPIRA02_06980 [Nitrospirales bacterium]|nr:MAG: hypothetical protein NPIRA02_06980 [Nitrospirales bacterium]